MSGTSFHNVLTRCSQNPVSCTIVWLLSYSPFHYLNFIKKCFCWQEEMQMLALCSFCTVSGGGVNEWQSVLITRRGYLGLVRLISPNAFQFLMLPNCRLLRAGPLITAGHSPAWAHGLQSSVAAFIRGECSLSLSESQLTALTCVHDLCLCSMLLHSVWHINGNN